MSHLSLWRRTAIAFAFAAACSFAHAADTTGRIKGTVTDPTGAALPNVTVTATNEATGVTATTRTSSSGDYLFQALPVGTYDITVAPGNGFKGFAAKGVVINIDQEYVEAVQLAVGGGGDTIEVQADAVQVNTTDMQLNNIVTSAQMVELPLVGRGFTALETILPGVQASSDRFGSYSADGAQTQQSSYLINGADTNDIALNTVAFSPNLDALDQFNLVTGPLNAEYDRNSGGIVNATIKQGTNHFHGDIFEFYRDTFLNTGNWFSTKVNQTTGAITKTVPTYHQNIFGGTVGGPIIKDKLFFFFAYQGTHQVTAGTQNTNVLTSAERTGDFSEDLGAAGGVNGFTFSTNPIPGTLSVPGCVTGSAANADTWASCAAKVKGNFAGAINPIASKLTSTYIPTPNSGSNVYSFASISPNTTNQYIGRLDYSLNPRNTFTGLYIHSLSNSTPILPFTGATVPGFGEIDNLGINQYTFDFTHQFTPTLLNDLALHYTRFNFKAVTPQNIVSPQSLGFDIFPANAAAASVPSIGVGNLQYPLALGFSTNGPQPRIDQTYQIDESVSKSFGHHNLKFGYDGRKFQVTNPFSANNSGAFSYNNSSNQTSGDTLLDFLVGNPAGYAQGTGATIQAYAFLNYFFAQDTWKVTNNFTFDYGLGYQIDTPLHNLQYGGEAITCFIPNQQSKVFTSAPLGINYPGDPGCANSASARTRYGDFGPRIGFAFTPNLGILSAGDSKKLAIRGGFGIYYNRTEEETSLNNLQTPPYGLGSFGVSDYGGNAPTFANPYQDVVTGQVYPNKFPYTFPKPGQTIDYSVFEPLELNTYSNGFRSPYAENFQLSVEREMPSHIVTRLTYVASLGRHNQTTSEGSPITPAGHAACLASPNCSSLATSFYRNYQGTYYYTKNSQYNFIDPNTGSPAYGSIGVVGSEGVSNYNSFQASVEKGLSHGLQFQLSYTFAHALDTASSYENTGYGGSARGYNQFQPSLNYGNANFDARHRLVFAPIYVIPFKTSGSQFSPVNLALAGWQVSGISTFATGFPYDISYGGSSSNSEWCPIYTYFYACPDEPNITGPMVLTNPRATATRNRWFTPSNLAPAAIGTFGNSARDANHGPGINNTNMILAKNFALSADGVRRLQIRMESDNVFNHTQFSGPASTVSTTQKLVNGVSQTVISVGSAGAISSAAAGRLTQLAAKIYF